MCEGRRRSSLGQSELLRRAVETSLGTVVLAKGDPYFCSFGFLASSSMFFSYIVIHSLFPPILQNSIVPILQPYVSGLMGTVGRELRDQLVNKRAALPPHLSEANITGTTVCTEGIW